MLPDFESWPPAWFVSTISSINELVSSQGVLSRFRRMVTVWQQEHECCHKEHEQWKLKRQEHFEKVVKTTPLLREETATAPQPGWVWDSYVRMPNKITQKNPNKVISISGWTPRELASPSEPVTDLPLPFDGRLLTIAEKYAIVAAIHDYSCKGRERINPWLYPAPNANVPTRLEATAYKILTEQRVPDLIEQNKEVLEKILATVKADLSKSDSIAARSDSQPQNPLDRLRNPILCTLVAGIVGETPSNVAAKLKRRHYVVITEARKNHCEIKHAATIWPHKKAALEKYLKNAESDDE